MSISITAQPNWWPMTKPGYSMGRLEGRQIGFGDPTCGSNNYYPITLTRLTFTAPDGTEYELRDQNSNGQPACVVRQSGRSSANHTNRRYRNAPDYVSIISTDAGPGQRIADL